MQLKNYIDIELLLKKLTYKKLSKFAALLEPKTSKSAARHSKIFKGFGTIW